MGWKIGNLMGSNNEMEERKLDGRFLQSIIGHIVFPTRKLSRNLSCKNAEASWCLNFSYNSDYIWEKIYIICIWNIG